MVLKSGANWHVFCIDAMKEVANTVNEDKRRLKDLERENARLKKMYAELSMDHEILSEGYQMLKKWQAQDENLPADAVRQGRNDWSSDTE